MADNISCAVLILSLVGLPSCLGMIGWRKLLIHVSTVMVFILHVHCDSAYHGALLLVLAGLILEYDFSNDY